jgi:hypothetical protein
VYDLETAVSVAQQFLRGANAPQYVLHFPHKCITLYILMAKCCRGVYNCVMSAVNRSLTVTLVDAGASTGQV